MAEVNLARAPCLGASASEGRTLGKSSKRARVHLLYIETFVEHMKCKEAWRRECVIIS